MESQPKPVVTGYPAAPQRPQPGGAAASSAAPAHGAAYPYPAPPYYPAPGPYYDPNAAYSHRTANASALFLRRFIICCISFFLVVGLATFVVWLVLRPRLPEIAVTSVSVSSFGLSGSQELSADFNLTLSVRNRNKKMGIFYDKVDAAVFYGPEPIAETSLPPFYQEKGNSTNVSARLAAVAKYVDDDVAGDLAEERSGGGGVRFNVRVLAFVRFRAAAWMTRRHMLRVFCGGVRVGFSNATATAGLLLGQATPCQNLRFSRHIIVFEHWQLRLCR